MKDPPHPLQGSKVNLKRDYLQTPTGTLTLLQHSAPVISPVQFYTAQGETSMSIFLCQSDVIISGGIAPKLLKYRLLGTNDGNTGTAA